MLIWRLGALGKAMDGGEVRVARTRERRRRALRIAAYGASREPSRAARSVLAPQPNIYPPGVTIIICTYNRLPLLKKMVDSILPQLPADYPVEVLIVDNNSTDGTANYACGLSAQNPAFSYYLEIKQGLSNARNGGAKAARHDFLLYCDDDAFLSPTFIKTMGEALATHDPDLFGGPCLPDYVDPKPEWFPEALEIRRKADVSGFYNHVTLSGSNFGIRKSVLHRIGGFNPEFGMTGNRPGMLEERLAIETYRRMTPAAEQKVYYSVESFVYHYTPSSRMHVGFQLRRIYQANFNYIKYCLEQGVRSPGLLASSLLKRLGGEIVRLAATAPAIWRERKTTPERPMNELVRLTYRAADAHAALHFLATDWGRTGRRLADHVEDRPLDILVLHSSKPGKPAPHLEDLAAALSQHRVKLCNAHGLPSKQVHTMIETQNPRTLDVIVTDNPKSIALCDQIRAHLPHLQVLLWARDPRYYSAAQRPWTRWRTPGELMTQVRTMRKAARLADQVVWSASPGGRIARILLGARRWAIAGAAGGDSAPRWREIMRQALIWAPRRLSP
jgi:glycosyltransferase involved in cell wall biosynthesis